VESRHGAVTKRAKQFVADSWQSQANLSFFLGLQVLIAFVLPVLGFGRSDLRLYSDLGFSILLVSGVAIAWGQWRLFTFAGVISLAALAVRWIAWFRDLKPWELASDGFTVAASVAIALVLLRQIFRDGPVTSVRIQGAIAVYLLFGVGWAHAYHIVNVLRPGSFALPANPAASFGDWIYFSYSTLTTVGYGDITPVGPVARTLAMGEALTGQLYLAVLIARLVAMEIIYWQERHMRQQ